MPTKDSDPLAGVEDEARQCSGCGLIANTQLRKTETIITWDKCVCDSGPIKPVRLLPEPAVRKAMVEWLRVESGQALLDNENGLADGLRILADRLEAGGGER